MLLLHQRGYPYTVSSASPFANKITSQSFRNEKPSTTPTSFLRVSLQSSSKKVGDA